MDIVASINSREVALAGTNRIKRQTLPVEHPSSELDIFSIVIGVELQYNL